MRYIKFILLAFLIAFSCFLLFACSETVDEEELTEETEVQVEKRTVEDNEGLDEKQKDDPEPFPGSSFKHEVNMKVNGVIEKDKGEEWWKLD